MFALERRQLIVQEARVEGRIDVAGIADSIGVSTETVRRDLSILERQGILKRVHGGAVLIELASPVPVLSERTDIMAAPKRAIGKLAAMHLPESGTILIDAGTTTAQLALVIPEDRELTVVTNALPTAEAIAHYPLLDIHVLGGRLRSLSLATMDSWALQQLEALDVDVAFMGTYGISNTRGFSTPDSHEAAVKRAMVGSAKKVVVMADHTKLDRSFMNVFAPLDGVDVLITDSGASRSDVAALRVAGVNVEQSRSSRESSADAH
ncbi:DeoR/GlpR family DNA-binding transcription regulator [Subtercola lobariae]|uniref:Lactose phosphotransferase system repressor n=1 Tax=Subtercola lobariae TaxID=1588641 RepID=A0A917B4L9_9MICO|nr:DeoR/GlpR family DNA-binding transcription regulator [Subtercola lobariae]GGF18357.1 DeoR family transcriptional regulator [Subtercola lobariae]